MSRIDPKFFVGHFRVQQGEGQVEGVCKNLIGCRLKANAARWRVRRVNRMAGLCSLAYSDQWAPYWEIL